MNNRRKQEIWTFKKLAVFLERCQGRASSRITRRPRCIRTIGLISSYTRFLKHRLCSVFMLSRLASCRSSNNSELVLESVTRSRLRFPSFRFLRVCVRADKFSRREIQSGLHHRAPLGGFAHTTHTHTVNQIKYWISIAFLRVGLAYTRCRSHDPLAQLCYIRCRGSAKSSRSRSAVILRR